MPRTTRRQFLRTSAAGVAVLGAPAFIRARNPNEKLNIAVIGCWGRGKDNLKGVGGENIVALCDVSEENLGKAAAGRPHAKQFRDFRKLYDGLKDTEFDAVVVSTTEHTHAFATLPALKRKKHVYCEKPLAHNIREARIIAAAAKEAGVATQLGTQIHAGSNYRRVVELIQAKEGFGPVSEVHVWVSRAWGWQSPEDAKLHKDIVQATERPKESMPVPRSLDWDLWLGPAPARPFNEVYVPGPKWYRWWDFGNGTMSDLGAHWIDLPFWALKLDIPHIVIATGPPPHPELAPASFSAWFHFGARGGMPPASLSWYQGEAKPTLWTDKKIPQWSDGCLFVGQNGRMLLSNYDKHILLGDAADIKPPEKTIPDSIGHYAEWIKACKDGSPTTCPFSYAAVVAESNHLGNVAYRSGERVDYDWVQMRVRNNPKADQFLGREYRKGWELV
jgi:predicted dehydrogenase